MIARTGGASPKRGFTGMALVAVAWIVAGCSSPSTIAAPHQEDVALDSATVTWTTTAPTLGAVRFGSSPGRYLTVAYPVAAGRSDRAFTQRHRVPLLEAATGDTVYVQALDETAEGVLTAGAEHRFVIGPRPARHPALTWTMIDVGFGDSHLLTMPNTGARILIDAGERRDGVNVDRYLTDAGVTRLDAVLATHAHEDHIGGMVGESFVADDGVLERDDVGAFLDGPGPSASRPAYEELLGIIARRGIPRRVVQAGETDADNAALAWDPEIRVEVLNAGGGRALGGDTESHWLNDDSIVLRIGYGDVQLVFGGDAESPVESKLLSEHATLEAEVLKVHHHGHVNASDPAYLDAVDPRAAMIPMTVYESYNGSLPSAVVLDRLRQRHVDIYGSDRAMPLGLTFAGNSGINVTVATDGASYQIRIEASRTMHWPGTAAAWSVDPVREGGATR